MNKRVFIGFLVIIFAFLAGWIFYISSQARQPVPMQKISADWWGSGHADVKSESFTHWNEDEPTLDSHKLWKMPQRKRFY